MAKAFPSPNNPQRSGVIETVKTRDKGFVFITGDDGEQYFAHRSAFATQQIFDRLAEGDAVTFYGARTEKGWRANRIDLIAAQEWEEERHGNA